MSLLMFGIIAVALYAVTRFAVVDFYEGRYKPSFVKAGWGTLLMMIMWWLFFGDFASMVILLVLYGVSYPLSLWAKKYSEKLKAEKRQRRSRLYAEWQAEHKAKGLQSDSADDFELWIAEKERLEREERERQARIQETRRLQAIFLKEWEESYSTRPTERDFIRWRENYELRKTIEESARREERRQQEQERKQQERARAEERKQQANKRFYCDYCGNITTSPGSGSCLNSPTRAHRWTLIELGRKHYCEYCGSITTVPGNGGMGCHKSPNRKHRWRLME